MVKPALEKKSSVVNVVGDDLDDLDDMMDNMGLKDDMGDFFGDKPKKKKKTAEVG